MEGVRLERTCQRCSYATSRPVLVCPICEVPLVLQERTWAPSRGEPWLRLPGKIRSTMGVRKADRAAEGLPGER